MSYTELPYSFDLLFDIKSVETLHDILLNKDGCFQHFLDNASTDIFEIEEMMDQENIPYPEGYTKALKPDFPKEVWVDRNGGYLTYEPIESEKDEYQKMKRAK